MYETKTLREKIKLFTIILFPILITQIGMYGMNFFDTIMAGKAGPDQLAGVAIGSSIWVPVFTGLNGILMAISPIVAQLKGAKKDEEISYSVKQGIYLSVLLAGVIGTIGLFLLDPILSLLDITPTVRYVAKYYLITLGIGIVPLFVFNILRSFVDALGQTKISMMVILMALPVNILFNYMFIFGRLGAPELGGVGAGVASELTYWVSLYYHHPCHP
ncbi:Na(+)/drug antiporter [Halobacillus karajensis]|uniref:Probable multidrug resistance protein NorM n=1 Tax=Halobacillus karajensis TaxID=195088 RepID=A0A024P7B4_9BACI|nr:Na(+)/drug antiporter [Halobacillus karajensis]CDQ24750.1 Na(+)/drug antiporter [Halobacillus karajensis]CDQ28890.1 Na(+)/drug antiporter [Halobacillus karajensis]